MLINYVVVTRLFAAGVFSLLGAKIKLSLSGTFVPWNFRSLELSYPGNFRSLELSLLGNFVPGNFRSRTQRT